jgi:hypothetical protein
VAGIKAIAEANGDVADIYKGDNVDAINAYYKALFGEEITDSNKEEAMNKLNEIKEKNEEAAKQAEEDSANSVASSAVSEGLVESTEAFEAYRDAMIDANTQ